MSRGSAHEDATRSSSMINVLTQQPTTALDPSLPPYLLSGPISGRRGCTCCGRPGGSQLVRPQAHEFVSRRQRCGWVDRADW